MSAANENMLSSAESMLNTIVSTKYFLYGGRKRLSTCRNSFILVVWMLCLVRGRML